MNSLEQTQLAQITVGAEYEHYKGKRYKILGVFRHTEDLKLHVCYEALYDCGEYGNFWARPLDMFIENIVINGIEQPRFKQI